jgi:hypothetical protein
MQTYKLVIFLNIDMTDSTDSLSQLVIIDSDSIHQKKEVFSGPLGLVHT